MKDPIALAISISQVYNGVECTVLSPKTFSLMLNPNLQTAAANFSKQKK